MRGDGGPGALPVQSGKGADSRVASNGRDARTSDEADVAEPQFTEAISVEEFRRQQDSAGEATVEEVKGEDGLTVDERVEKFKRERPDEFAALQRRREAIRAARKAAADNRQDFLSSLNLDLLTEEQRRVHALYVEANETRNALRKEISALRREGKEIPADLQVRLADAESVLCADREREQGALREAAARAAGLDESAVRQLTKDLMLIDSAFVP